MDEKKAAKSQSPRIVTSIPRTMHTRIKRFAEKQSRNGGKFATIQSATEYLLGQGLKSLNAAK